MTYETVLSIFLGIGLAASVGFRVFLPLFVLSLAANSGLWDLNANWEWLGSLAAVITFGVATVVEILAYFIPYIDNLLDSIAVPLAAVAGTAVMVSTVTDLDPLVTWALAIIAGGGTAAAISGSSGATRMASTASTAGFANPLVAGVETISAAILAVLSIFLPVVAFIAVIMVFYIIFRLYKKINAKTS